MGNATIKREVKRILRHAAPGLASRLREWAAPSVSSPDTLLADHFDGVRKALTDAQRCFDEAHPVPADRLTRIAQNSSLIVVGIAPFANVAMLVDALAKERIVLRELIIVDATPEEPRLVAIRDHRTAWSRRLPLTRFTVVPYSRQELRFADAVNEGFRLAREQYAWIAGRDLVPLDGCIEYLFKALIAAGDDAIVVSKTRGPDGRLQSTEIASECLSDALRAQLLKSDRLDALDRHLYAEQDEQRNRPLLEPLVNFRQGVLGGARTSLAENNEALLDPRFITHIAVADLSVRLGARNAKIVCTPAASAWTLRAEATDAAAPWEVIHDWRWLVDKRAGGVADADRIELVCPFHRGDVVLATQVAAYAVKLGRRVRMHVAAPLVSWVRDFAPELAVEALPVDVASAEQTYPLLLQSYLYVSQRPDASPTLARCHPSRGLSETGQNLIEYMLEEVSLPISTLLPNVEPSSTDEHRRIAAEVAGAFGQDVVFLHPFGGWSLKSLPDHILAEFAQQVHAAGLKLVQIGGAGDARLDVCDGAILQNFMPAQWREILRMGRALAGVDSWTAHFGAILDIPQITLYGSTHPKHVNTKRFFAEQSRPCLILGPIVNCSPCNSLTCVAFPERDYCTGYAIDSVALETFLQRLLV